MIDDPLPSDVRSALEACRPDRQDERLPEIAAALASTQPERVAKARRAIEGVDRTLATAIRQAPVPDGLAERVMACIAVAQEPAAPSKAASAMPKAAMPDGELLVPADRSDVRWGDELASVNGHHSRRSWLALVASSSLAIAATLLLAFLIWPRATVDVAELQSQAVEFYDNDEDNNEHRPALNTEALPTALGGVAADKVIGWHQVELFRRSGHGYDLANRGAKGTLVKGTLYVLPLNSWFGPKLRGLNVDPVPQSTSAATVAAWADDTHVFILVVKGGRPAFASFLPRRVA